MTGNIKYCFYPILFILMLLYRLLIFINKILYVTKLIKTKKFDIPIISIGNIEVGGTGKTPFVIYLAKMLQNSKKPSKYCLKNSQRNIYSSDSGRRD